MYRVVNYTFSLEWERGNDGKNETLGSDSFFVSFAVFACDKASQAGPKEVLSSYLDAHLKGRSEKAYSYISSEDKAVKDLQTYIKENDLSKDIPFSKYLMSKCSYKILELDQSENEASADVEMTIPDLSAMLEVLS